MLIIVPASHVIAGLWLRILGATGVALMGVVAGVPAAVVFAAFMLVMTIREMRTWARVDANGIEVRNRLLRRRILWPDVRAIEVRRQGWPAYRRILIIAATFGTVPIVASQRITLIRPFGDTKDGLDALRQSMLELKENATGSSGGTP
jgi:hypothetical protein